LQAVGEGDFPIARVLLRAFINATLGFAALAEQVGMSDKSLMRMFGPRGNPRIENLSAVLHTLKAECRLSLRVNATPAKPRRSPPDRIAA
jgi:DNA-binding phage protein